MDIVESNQGKDNREHFLGISVRNQAKKERWNGRHCEPYNIFTVILCMVHLLFVMTVNHLQKKLCFDTCCYYFSVFQSLLFCSKIHLCKNTRYSTMELKSNTSLPRPLMLGTYSNLKLSLIISYTLCKSLSQKSTLK